MYLQQLELHGFKSFADRTQVHFDPGVTAIVGPNGCGKSNIIDAVRWVLGEQRARLLRSERMENVIFNGTAKRRPLGLSEVSLTIENTRNVLPTQYTEVTITRRLYRSGESEYLINKTPCRLRDITDLFMDTGMGANAYSVIELKMTDDILSDNAQDRRRLFEEAAGITKYKMRRTQALRKLKDTQTDLTRLRDLVDEINKQVQNLGRQANKAARHRQMTKRLHRLELQVAQVEYDRLSTEEVELRSESRILKDRIESLTNRQTGEEATIESLRTELIDREHRLADRQRTLNALVDRIRAMEAALMLEKERSEAAARNLDRAERERIASENQRATLEEALDEQAERLAEAAPRLDKARQARDAARTEKDRTQAGLDAARAHLRGLRTEEQQAGDQRARAQNDLNRLYNRIELLERQQAQAAEQDAEIARTLADLEAQLQTAEAQLDTERTAVEEARLALTTAETRLAGLRAELDEAQPTLHALERRLDALNAEFHLLESLLASYEDVSAAVQFLATHPTWTDRPRTVADLLACDEADRAAIDAALGDFAACFVVATEAEARAGLALLRDEAQGRAAFMILDRLPDIVPPSAAPAGTRPALAAVRVADAAVQPLANVLLRTSFLVDTLDEARHHAFATAAPGTRFIARTGEWADAQGRVYGGSPSAPPSAASGRLGRQERLDALRAEAASVDAERAEQAERLDTLKTRLANLPVEALRRALRDAEHQAAQADRSATQLRYQAEVQARNRARLDTQTGDLRQALTDSAVRLEQTRQAVADTETALRAIRDARAEAEDAFQAVDVEARVAMDRFSEANVAAVQAQHAHDTLERDQHRIRRDIQTLQERDEQRAEDVKGFEADIETALSNRADLESDLADAYQEKRAADAAVNDAEAEVMEIKGLLSEKDVQLRDVRRLREEALRKESTRATRLVELQTRLEDLVERIQQEHEVYLIETTINLDDDFDEEDARSEIPDLRGKIRSLGAVNELALESYEEEKKRLDFMTEQLHDLERAEHTLLDTISEINTTASERFHETFSKVKRNFSDLFTELFGEGARADVVLTGDGDPLEDAIEVIAYPRGKKPSTISQLSGGEKTLTATALLFAIYLVKPSPFCILDEVDAPLDDANVHRFMKLIRKFSASTQFILVTHNKLTMEAADRMYGVTMAEQGVSKLVGVTFDDLVEPVET